MLKRLLDLLASILGLIAAFPLMLFISIWIKIDSNGDVKFNRKKYPINGVLALFAEAEGKEGEAPAEGEAAEGAEGEAKEGEAKPEGEAPAEEKKE